MTSAKLLHGDCLEVMRTIEREAEYVEIERARIDSAAR